MFYQTTLQSVKNGVAVDVQGKRLSFIGYLQVQAGDTVWTDGNVIFGNVPPKGTPNIAEPLKGVPVLGKNLRGYITKIGGYKGKNIAIDDWITNDDRNFKHGEKIFNGQKVIDAVYLKNDSSEQNEVNLYVVTDGLYQKNQCVKYNNHLWIWHHSTLPFTVDSTIAYSVHAYIEAYQGEEITLGVESANVNQPMKIYRDDDLINEIDLKPYADFITEKVQATEQELMSLSANSGVNYFKQPAPPKPFIASAYARPITFRISNTGDWDAIIFASAYGYCFPYETMEGSVLEGTFNDKVGASTAFSEDLISCLSRLEQYIFSDNYFPFLQIEKYPSFTGEKKNNGVYTEAYKKYIEEKIEYYIPLVRFQWSMWFTVTFGGSCLLRVHNGEIISVMRLDISGGNYIRPVIKWNETYRDSYFLNVRMFIDDIHEISEWTFPIEDGFYFAGRGSKIKSVFDSNNNLIADFSTLNLNIGLYCTRMNFLTLKDDHIDSQAENVRALINAPNIDVVWGRYVEMLSSDYTVEDKDGERYFYESHGYLIYDEYPNLKNIENHSLMDGFFDAQSDDGFFRFNPCVCKLSDENYLIGVHEGEFFVKRNGAWEKINDNLKNFRLCEMKNLNKAKREGI